MQVTELQVLEELASYTFDPLSYTLAVFPWGEGELATNSGPYLWQKEVLATIRDHLQHKETRYQPLRIAISSGHGIGKTALMAFVTKWGLGTCDDCKIVATANTATQLATKTSPEFAKWFRWGLDEKYWEVKATSITSREKGRDKTWRCDLIPWSENNTEAFAGLHNKRKRIIVIYDEASGIADKVWEVTEGALTDEETEIIWLAFGNPTQNTGRFRECFGKFKHRWITRQIDSRTVEGTNKQEIEKWVKDYGEDSDFVRVRVKGEFPRAGSNQFIPSDIVAKCRETVAEGYINLPKILSIDVARFGDDQTVFGLRQGRHFRILARHRGIDTVQTAQHAIDWINRELPDSVVVDGDGLGAGVVDNLKHRGLEMVHEFHGGEQAEDSEMYFNRRAEIWGLTRNWLKEGADIPDDPELESDLTGPQYGFSAKQQIQLEKKEDMKKRGLASPDTGDCLAMTFAVKLVVSREQKRREEIEQTLAKAVTPTDKMLAEHRIMLEEKSRPVGFKIKRNRFGRRM